MSKFKTSIPVDVSGVRKLLPPGAFENAVIFNEEESAVEIHWEHDQFKTPFTFEKEFPVENLTQQEAPKGVVQLRPRGTNKTEGADATEPQTETPLKAETPDNVPTAEEKAVAGKKRRK